MGKKLLFSALFMLATAAVALGHNPDAAPAAMRGWHLKNLGHVHASFLMAKNDSVFLEDAEGQARAFSMADFSPADRDFIEKKRAAIVLLNRPRTAAIASQVVDRQAFLKKENWKYGLAVFGLAGLACLLFLMKKRGREAALALCGAAVLTAFMTGEVGRMLGTDPAFVDSAFEPFKPNVATHWDATWFYVESNGLPTTHSMMTGIKSWQQQVPIPQCYTGANAWQIPLNPVLAAQPVPVNDQHFLRGAVAIAANGIPIFNPHTNTGVDAFLDGQLDQWGGHSGRADDYHYHIAPMFLDTQTVDILPIAFALDGFAIYADHEPDGSQMLPLDANHGHFDGAGVYHYHGTPEAPYMIGNMVGQVTEDATLQIVPQPKAKPVRPSLTPLNGAVITGFQPNGSGNGYILTYTRNGETFQVDYSWTPTGVYTYNFISPTGTTTETYNGQTPCTSLVSTGDFFGETVGATVFPNPASDGFILKINGLEAEAVLRVLLFDQNGRLVFQKERPGLQPVFEGLARGIYLLKIDSEKGSTSRKIIVQ